MATSAHRLLTTLSLRSSRVAKVEGMRNCCGRKRESGADGDDGAIVVDVEAYGPPHENPRGNFAERTSISCIQWDIGIKRV